MAYSYVASPYTHKDPEVMHERFLLAERYVARALIAKYWVYSPIVHCHELARKYNLPVDHEFWEQYDFAMLERAVSLRILQLPDWEISKGVASERRFAIAHGIPIIDIPPNHEWLREPQPDAKAL